MQYSRTSVVSTIRDMDLFPEDAVLDQHIILLFTNAKVHDIPPQQKTTRRSMRSALRPVIARPMATAQSYNDL